MAGSFNSIWRELSMYNTDIPVPLIQAWVNEGWTKVYDAKLWSWAIAEGSFQTIPAVDAGTLTVTNANATVTATTSPFTTALVGQQIKINNQVYTIDSRADANNVDLDRSYPLATGTATGKVFTAYISAPTDFFGFVSVIDVANSQRIWTNIDMKRLDLADPKRTATGNPTVLADRKWKTSPSSATTVPMYELYPHATSAAIRDYKMLYWKVPADFSKTAGMPHTIPDRIIKNYALARMSRYPGDVKNPNPMHSRLEAAAYMQEFRDDLIDAVVRDDEIYDTDLWLDTKMAHLSGPIGRTENSPFPSYGYYG